MERASAESLLVVGERPVGIDLEARRRVDIALDPIAALLDHLADARQRDLLHDEKQDQERHRQPKELRCEVVRIELRQSFGFGGFLAASAVTASSSVMPANIVASG